MKNISFYIILKIFLIFTLINFSFQEIRYFPETYKEKDLIIPDNDKTDDYQYNLVEAKVLTKELITLYIKKQGINLEQDECCQGFNTFNAWGLMETESELEEIYSNTVFNPTEKVLTYNFPVPRIENEGYTLYHKVWIFDKGEGSPQCNIYFNSDPLAFNINLDNGKLFLELEIVYNENDNTFIVKCNGNEKIYDMNYYISKISFEFPDLEYSPAISLHWTYYKIKLGKINFTLRGSGLCSLSNPCLKGYTCVGGLCERCHASCFDCKNGGLSTDCDTKCSTHSARLTPDRGSCPLGYVDLSQFESFSIMDIIPPTRNNRITISFWMYLTSFPQNEIKGEIYTKNHLEDSYQPKAIITNSYDRILFIRFYFTNEDVFIDFGRIRTPKITLTNTWFFVKCAYSPDHGRRDIYVKYYQNENFQYIFLEEDVDGDGSGSNCEKRKYHEPDDYINVRFEGFNQLYNNEIPFNFYMRQYVMFREYVQEPYDNKYFNYEKIFTSTFELPEVLFIIPFDELIKNDNKYDIKCYSYAGSILEYRITLTPYYYQKNYTLYPPKLFQSRNLLQYKYHSL